MLKKILVALSAVSLFAITAVSASGLLVEIDGKQYGLVSLSIGEDGVVRVTTDENASTTPPTTDPVVSYSLNTSVPSGGGSISRSPNRSEYSEGESVRLTANPASGYTFSRWGGDCAGNGPCDLVMNSNKSVSATFEPQSTGACPTRPSDVRVLDGDWSGMIATISRSLGSSDVVSFEVTAETAKQGTFSSVYTTVNQTSRSMWVSRCPGDVESLVEPGCARYSRTGNTTIEYISGSTLPGYCNLEVGERYYVNVRNAVWNRFDETTCPSGDCPFYFYLR